MIRIVVPGPPPKKNKRDRAGVSKRGRPYRYTAGSFKAWCAALLIAVGKVPRISSGRWTCRVYAFHKSMRHLDVDVPHGDSDGPVSCVFDGLQRVGVLDDDARIVVHTASKHYDKKNPRTVIELEEWDP